MRARALLAAVAVLAIAWLAVLLRDYELATSAADRLPDVRGPAVDRELDRLRDAEFLNPSSEPLYLRAFHLTNLQRSRAGAREAEKLTEREPENAEAWAVLALATRDDPRRSAAAVRELRRLSQFAR